MYLLQIDTNITVISLLITAVTALAGVVISLFKYNKDLQKELKASGDAYATRIKELSQEYSNNLQTIAKEHSSILQNIYREQIKDNKEVIQKNTEAFVKHTEAVDNSAEISEELKEKIVESANKTAIAIQELRIWLKENYGGK